jgi:diguanylate cyclase (GGDEF)-like protein/PAS domain S-box-containing protein
MKRKTKTIPVEESLRKYEEEYRLLVENSHDIIYKINADGIFIFVSPAWTTLLGHPVTQVVGKSFKSFVHPDDIPGCMVFLQTVLKSGQRQKGAEYRVQHIDGTWYWHTSSAVPLKDEGGMTIGFYGIASDITERKHLQDNLVLQATTDELTGVSNRRYFLELASRELKRAVRLNHPLAIAIIDIDHFKTVNDIYGHAAGDQALLTIAKICQKNIREIDVFARMGGDEFALLLPETKHDQAYAIVERIRLTLESLTMDIAGKTVTITISSGISILKSKDESLDILLSQADKALYKAKESGRNRVILDPASS